MIRLNIFSLLSIVLYSKKLLVFLWMNFEGYWEGPWGECNLSQRTLQLCDIRLVSLKCRLPNQRSARNLHIVIFEKYFQILLTQFSQVVIFRQQQLYCYLVVVVGCQRSYYNCYSHFALYCAQPVGRVRSWLIKAITMQK